jgi:hypothetical protein
MLAFKVKTPVNHPEESIQHYVPTFLTVWTTDHHGHMFNVKAQDDKGSNLGSSVRYLETAPS